MHCSAPSYVPVGHKSPHVLCIERKGFQFLGEGPQHSSEQWTACDKGVRRDLRAIYYSTAPQPIPATVSPLCPWPVYSRHLPRSLIDPWYKRVLVLVSPTYTVSKASPGSVELDHLEKRILPSTDNDLIETKWVRGIGLRR